MDIYFRPLKRLLTDTEFKIILTIVFFLFFSIFRGLMGRVINKREKDLRRKYITRQTTNYILTIVFITFLGFIWVHSFDRLLSFLGIISAGLIITGKDVLMNLFASLVILWRGTFEVGDRIEIGRYRGDVMDTGAMYITLAELSSWDEGSEPSGRVIKIPNGLILTTPIANYTTGLSLIWNEISFSISLDSNWEKVQNIALEIANDISYQVTDKDWNKIKKNYEEFIYNHKEPKCYFEISNSKIKFTIRYVSKLYTRRATEDKFWHEFLKKIQGESDIQMV